MKMVDNTEMSPDMLVEAIRERKAEIERTLKEREESHRDDFEGKLRITKKGNSLQYYYRHDPSDKEGVYLKREQNSFASALAQNDYDRKLINELKLEIRALGRVLDDYRPERVDEIFISLHDNRKPLINPVTLLEEDYVKRWMSVEYNKKSIEENVPEYYTANGERVRSKSELMIADALSRRHIPYRYEFPIYIPGIGCVHPDFTCLNVRKRKECFWEHYGMMADSVYADNAVNKIEKYTLAGYHPGGSLIMSFESSSHPLSSRIIEHNIKMFLL